MCIGMFPLGMFVYHICVQCLTRPEESTGSPGTEVTVVVNCHVGAVN